jgi:antitoxin YefM
MSIHITFSQAHTDFERLCSHVVKSGEIVIIEQPESDNVALISASELLGLIETVHLFRSPKNEKRLLTALNRALSRGEAPMRVEELKNEIGLNREE